MPDMKSNHVAGSRNRREYEWTNWSIRALPSYGRKTWNPGVAFIFPPSAIFTTAWQPECAAGAELLEQSAPKVDNSVQHSTYLSSYDCLKKCSCTWQGSISDDNCWVIAVRFGRRLSLKRPYKYGIHVFVHTEYVQFVRLLRTRCSRGIKHFQCFTPLLHSTTENGLKIMVVP